MSGSVMVQAEQEVLITRVFAASRELVFKAWTDPEHLMHWYAPRGCSIHFRTLDLRPGSRRGEIRVVGWEDSPAGYPQKPTYG